MAVFAGTLNGVILYLIGQKAKFKECLPLLPCKSGCCHYFLDQSSFKIGLRSGGFIFSIYCVLLYVKISHAAALENKRSGCRSGINGSSLHPCRIMSFDTCLLILKRDEKFCLMVAGDPHVALCYFSAGHEISSVDKVGGLKLAQLTCLAVQQLSRSEAHTEINLGKSN